MIAATQSPWDVAPGSSLAPFSRFEGLCIATGTVVIAVVLRAADLMPHRRRYKRARSRREFGDDAMTPRHVADRV